MLLILLLSTTLSSPLPELFLLPSPTTIQWMPPYGHLSFLGRFPWTLPAWNMHTLPQGTRLFLEPDGDFRKQGSLRPEAVLFSLRAREDSRIFLYYGQPIFPAVSVAGGFFSTTFTGEQLGNLQLRAPGLKGIWLQGKTGEGEPLSWWALNLDTGKVHLFAFRERADHWELTAGLFTWRMGFRRPDNRLLLAYQFPQGMAGIAWRAQTFQAFPYLNLTFTTLLGRIQLTSDLDPSNDGGAWAIRFSPLLQHSTWGEIHADLELTADTSGVAGGARIQTLTPGDTPFQLVLSLWQTGDHVHNAAVLQEARVGILYRAQPASAYHLRLHAGAGSRSTSLPFSASQKYIFWEAGLRFARVFVLKARAGSLLDPLPSSSPLLYPDLWWQVMLATWIVD